MTDHLKPNSHAWQQRQRRHRHNSFHGFARMAEMNMQAIIESGTATSDAKTIATSIWLLAGLLKKALGTRVD